MKKLIDKYLLGASMGTMAGCLIGMAYLPLFGLPFCVCLVGVPISAYIAQSEGKRLFGKTK